MKPLRLELAWSSSVGEAAPSWWLERSPPPEPTVVTLEIDPHLGQMNESALSALGHEDELLAALTLSAVGISPWPPALLLRAAVSLPLGSLRSSLKVLMEEPSVSSYLQSSSVGEAAPSWWLTQFPPPEPTLLNLRLDPQLQKVTESALGLTPWLLALLLRETILLPLGFLRSSFVVDESSVFVAG